MRYNSWSVWQLFLLRYRRWVCRDTKGGHCQGWVCRDTEGGHCQGACHPQWFFYLLLKVSDTALPFMCSCKPPEIHSLTAWTVRHRPQSPQASLTMGVEPSPLAWEARILPLHYCSFYTVHYAACWTLFAPRTQSPGNSHMQHMCMEYAAIMLVTSDTKEIGYCHMSCIRTVPQRLAVSICIRVSWHIFKNESLKPLAAFVNDIGGLGLGK